MKKELLLILGVSAMSIFINPVNLIAQQQIIEYDSDDQGLNEVNGPHLLLLETGDDGAMGDGWSRLWFKNSSDSDPLNRWSFLARPWAGAMDNDNILTQPLVMAHRAEQKFGFGSDGTLRINKQFVLPNMDGSAGQVMTTDGTGNVTWQTPLGGSGGNSSLLEDADMDSNISFLEGAGVNITDTISMNIGSAGNSFEIFRFFNGGIEGNRKIVVQTNSSSSSPQLRLVETGGNDAARLFFSNESTGNDWNMAVNGGAVAANVRFNVNYNGEERLSYTEEDSTYTILNRAVINSPNDDAASLLFTNEQTTSNRFRILADPSNTGTENASMHFDWKSSTLERDFMTFTADGNNVDPFIDFHQNTRYGTDPTALASEIRDEIFWNQNIAGQTTGSRVKVVNNASGLLSTRGLVSIAESTTNNAVVTGVLAEATATNGVAYALYGEESNPNNTDSWAMFANGDIWYTGTVVSPSDRRVKTNIKSAPKGLLNKLMQLEVKTYEYDGGEQLKHMNFPKGNQLGFIAQDIQAVFPDMVRLTKTPTDSPTEIDEKTEIIEVMGVEYNKLFPVLVSSIQEQQTQIDTLLRENQAMKNELTELRGLILEIKK
jgi:hypothetical protein